MRYACVCSGISAPTVAWQPLGWTTVFFAEIEPFPSAVLAHHYPNVPNYGDMTRFKEWPDDAIDVLVGGTPCQSFSVAGLRKGLDDPRGNLALVFLALADRYRPEWVVWENVPGVLSSNGGRDFGAFLGGLGELGFGFAWRCLDAQWFGLAQRRKRVFVVGHLGDWRRAAAVLFEPEGLRGDPAPSREARERVAPTISARPTAGGGLGTDFDCDGGLIYAPEKSTALWARDYKGTPQDVDEPSFIAHSLRGEVFDASEDGTGRGTPLVPVPYDLFQITAPINRQNRRPGDPCHTLAKDNASYAAIAFSAKDHGADALSDLSPTLRAGGHDKSHANAGVMPAVAFAQNQLDEVRTGDVANTLNTNSNASGRNTPMVAATTATVYGVSHADASKTGPDQALRALRQAVGEESFCEWGLGVVAALRQAEVLRSEVHGGGVRCEADDGHKLDDDALPCQKDRPGWTVQQMWQAGCAGCPPQGWRPPEQLARELGSYLSQLPHQRASAARFLLGLWRTSEGLGLLREALSAVQEVWRPAPDEGEPAPALFSVRRLTPREAERLQGFPDDFTAVPYRGKPAADGPRYKALGNSMAVPVLAWIGRRIALLQSTLPQREAAE